MVSVTLPLQDDDSRPVIRAQGLGKCYHVFPSPIDRLKQAVLLHRRRFYREFWALRNVSFEMYRGQTLGILGRNGSGKSTLLQLVAGTLTPTVGHVAISGRVAALLELGSGFNPEFTGRENARMTASIHGMPQNDFARRFDQIVAFSEIGEFIDQPVKTYSSGMFARLGFAISIHLDASILIVDEALAVGDEKFQRKCYDRIDELRAAGCAILFVSHSTTLIERICTRALLLDHGGVVADGPPKSVIDEYHRLLYEGETAYFNRLAAQSANVSRKPASLSPSNRCSDDASAQPTLPVLTITPEKRARITNVAMRDAHGVECYAFRSRSVARVTFDVECNSPISSLIAGLRIRTLEGVEVYGTSTKYFDKAIDVTERDQKLAFSFAFPVSLCEGVYSVSVAAASARGAADMEYLDKCADAFVFKVVETSRRASGIVDLEASVEVELK